MPQHRGKGDRSRGDRGDGGPRNDRRMKSADNATSAQPEPAPRRRVSPWRRALRLSAVAVALAMLVAGGWLAATGRTITLPSWLAAQLEARVNSALGGARVELRAVALNVARNGLPRVTLSRVQFFDASGQPLAHVSHMRSRLDRAALLRGEIVPSTLFLSGAEITLRRRTDGSFDLALGGGFTASGSVAGMLDGIDRAFATPPLSRIARIEAEDVTIILEDARSGRVWQVTGGSVSLTQDAEMIDLTVSAEVFNGSEQLAPVIIGFRSRKGNSSAQLTASFENAAAVDIAAQSPALAFLGVLDAPISGALNTVIGEDGTLASIAGKLEIGAGRLTPGGAAPPLRFSGGRAYFDYDPRRQRIDFGEISVDTESGRMAGVGHAYLEEFSNGWPGALVGQLRTSELVLDPPGVFEAPVEIAQSVADLRVRLAPYTVEIGQLVLIDGPRRALARGRVAAEPDGWHAALDVSLDRIEPERLLQVWPVQLGPKARQWLRNNVRSALVRNVEGAIRFSPDLGLRNSVSYRFDEAEVQILRTLPPARGVAGYASYLNGALTMVMEKGEVVAPQGGPVDVTGTVFRIPDTRMRPTPARVALAVEGALPDILAILDLPPFRFLSRAGRSPDIAAGRARAKAALAFDLGRRITGRDVTFSVEGVATGVRSEMLVPGRRFSAETLVIRADNSRLEVAGEALLDGARFNGAWVLPLGEGGEGAKGRGRVEGRLAIDQAFLDGFGIALPEGTLEGEGVGQFTLELRKDEPPAFTLISDLNRLRLRLAALGWSKPPAATGRLELAGRLGAAPRVERLVLRAPGLSAEGSVRLRPEGGGLDVARFDRLEVGDWLEARVTLTGRGPGRAPVVSFEGGRLDSRRARFGAGGVGGQGGSGPVQVALDRLVISEGIALTDFVGSFTTGRGLDGEFLARVNGGTAIRGRVIPQGGGLAFQVFSDDAGGVMADAGFLAHARGGKMQLTLVPALEPGSYDGALRVSDTRMVGAPGLAAILNAVSIVGLVDQLNNEGLRFETIEAAFRLTPDEVRILRSSATGPSAGISLDGTYDLARRQLDLQGVLSPAYLINGIGQIFTRRGEGLFGVTFTIRGAANQPRISVNPLSMLAPGGLREIFRRRPPASETAPPGQ
ncbi:AsmA-like C-terminal region [Meinhardsimonia xiamenensis]|uniref:AsmA-like C-terminal region n=2 Tax=Meinhardsimonia xiamenensis TaxID=990712 RepID=A0A1G9GGW1_9RHOB|nr:AsmA-like protein [Meinhardsimonia xiamenensis]SDK99919.1 AsmA-like C-terminal region [Meinhardsimonia xiamenensis]